MGVTASPRKTSMTKRLILTALPLLLVALAGCAGRIATPEGWSGGVVDGETLYIGTRAGDVRALDIKSGEEIHAGFTLVGEEAQRGVYGTPAIEGDTLYFGGYDGYLYARFTPSFDKKWEEPLYEDETEEEPTQIVGGPTVAGNVVLVGADNGKVYAFDQEVDDQNRWSVTRRWTFQTHNKVWSSPIAVDNVVYATSLDKNLYAISLEDGSKLWNFMTNGAIASTPTYDEDTVFVGSFDGMFYAVNAIDGNLRWKFDGAASWSWGEPLVHGDTVFAPSLDGNLYALDKRTGDLLWTLETEGPIVGSPAVIFDMIAIGSDDGRLHIVRISDGNPVDVCNMRTEIRSTLAVKDDVLFLSAKDKTIRALRIKTNGNPDEEWVHKPDEDIPVVRGRAPDC